MREEKRKKMYTPFVPNNKSYRTKICPNYKSFYNTNEKIMLFFLLYP